MQKSLLLFFISFLLIIRISAQTKPIINEEYIDNKLEELRFDEKISDNDKEKALFKLKAESEKIGYNWGILKSGRRVIEIYERQNKNKEIIKLATELKKIDAGPKAARTMANLYRASALSLGYLGLDEASLKDFRTAVAYAKKIEDPDVKNYTSGLIYSNITLYFFNKRLENKSYKDSIISYHKKSIAASELITGKHEEITTEKKYSNISFNYVRLAILYLEEANKPGNIEIAEKYLTKSLNIVNKYNLLENDNVILMNQLSWLYLEKKEYKKTIEYANLARDLEKQFPDPTNRVESFEFLSSAYTELGDTKNAKLYMDKYTHLKDSIRITEKNNADQSFNVLLSDSKKIEKRKSLKEIITVSVISCLLLFAVIIYWKRKNKILRKKYEKLITKLNSIDENQEISSNENLLQALENFEKSKKYITENISLASLANDLDTNTTYLSEFIMANKNNTYSEYIDNLKIKYILQKLVTDSSYREYDMNSLAEKCGYNSSKDFVKAFKNETGITPLYFINKLKKDNLYLNLQC
ncbi:hypothetical protein GCM10022217_29550 [Chryseobacterium ginsenosidimutans]|uniref:AraC family transcriptional regulator n=1 Tax=Chryseobacterium ginsenosidimutans TaxID=687846 RepID=UPI0031D53AB4